MMQMRFVSRYVVCAILFGLFGSATQVLADTIKIKATSKGPAFDLQAAAKAGVIPEGMLKDAEGKSVDAKAYTGSLVNANGNFVTPDTARVQPKGEYTLDTSAKPADFDPFASAEAAHYRTVTKRWYCKRHGRRHTKRVTVPTQISWSAVAVGGRVTVEPALTATRQPGETAEFTIKAKAKNGDLVSDLKVANVGDEKIITKAEFQSDKLVLTAGNPGTSKVVVASESDETLKFEVRLRVLQPEIASISDDINGTLELTSGDDAETVEFAVSAPNGTAIDNVGLRVHNSNPKAVKAELNGQTLKLTPIAAGDAVVSVRAARLLSPTHRIEVSVIAKPEAPAAAAAEEPVQARAPAVADTGTDNPVESPAVAPAQSDGTQVAEVPPATDAPAAPTVDWSIPTWFKMGLIILAAALFMIGAIVFLIKKRGARAS